MNNDNPNILLSFVLGAAAGLAAGMLLSPDTGEGNRKFIAQKATDLSKKATQKATDLSKKANDLSGQLSSQLNNTIGKITKSKNKPATTTGSVAAASTTTTSMAGNTGKKPKSPKTT